MPVEAGKALNAAGQVEGYEIFIKYLPKDTKEAPLRSFFADAGEIVGMPRLMTDAQGKCKGVGWITFATKEAMTEALRWNGCSFGGRHLSISVGKQAHVGIRPTLQAPGTHTPALIREVVAKLVSPDPSGTYVDATFGRGGHSRGILAALSPAGRLHAFDLDPEAVAAGEALAKEDSRFTIHHAAFGAMKATLGALGVRPSGILYDLGISSPQFDEAHRGFRLEADGPLDLRFDQTRGETAWQFLERADRAEIMRVISGYGETTDSVAARRIADAICLARAAKSLPRRTREFAALVARAKGMEYQAMHPAKLTFQALRIHLNDEFGQMQCGLRAGFDLVGDGGRLGVITWKHSECAIVVDFFRSLEAVREESPLYQWYRRQSGASAKRPVSAQEWALSMDETTRPSETELQANSRSRSALLHVLRKRRGPTLAEIERVAYSSLGWSSVESPSASAGTSAGKGAGSDGTPSALYPLSKSERRRIRKERKARKQSKEAERAEHSGQEDATPASVESSTPGKRKRAKPGSNEHATDDGEGRKKKQKKQKKQ